MALWQIGVLSSEEPLAVVTDWEVAACLAVICEFESRHRRHFYAPVVYRLGSEVFTL